MSADQGTGGEKLKSLMGARRRGIDLAQAEAVFREALVVFPWQPGDVLVVDNMLVAHGRMPFSGPWRVAVTMGAPVSISDVEAIGDQIPFTSSSGSVSESRQEQIRR